MAVSNIGHNRNFSFWRPGPDSNRCTRICNPVRSLSATWPHQKNLFNTSFNKEAIGGCIGAGLKSVKVSQVKFIKYVLPCSRSIKH